MATNQPASDDSAEPDDSVEPGDPVGSGDASDDDSSEPNGPQQAEDAPEPGDRQEPEPAVAPGPASQRVGESGDQVRSERGSQSPHEEAGESGDQAEGAANAAAEESEDTAGDAEEQGDESRSGNEMTWPRAIVLALAVGFLGFALALFLGRDRPVSSSSVDVGFYQDMTYHHDQAVEMALLQLRDGSDTTVLHFAREVLADQRLEIGWMERSLAGWGFTASDRPEEAMAWMGMPVPVEQMPGLMSEERMAQLAAAEGEESDALFLEMMAEHHVGGIHMAEYAARNAESDDVREVAGIMARNQAKEVNMYAHTAERLELPVQIEGVQVPSFDDEG